MFSVVMNILFLAIAVQTIGCTRMQLLQPEKHFIDTKQNITVHLKDKRRITFNADNFEVRNNDTSSYIQGHGTYETSDNINQKYNGQMNLKEIDKITSHELAPWGFWIESVLLAPVGLLIIWAIWPPSFH